LPTLLTEKFGGRPSLGSGKHLDLRRSPAHAATHADVTSAGVIVSVPAFCGNRARRSPGRAAVRHARDRLDAHVALRQLLGPEVLEARQRAQLEVGEREALVDLERVEQLLADVGLRLVEPRPQKDLAGGLGRPAALPATGSAAAAASPVTSSTGVRGAATLSSRSSRGSAG
jgi:hypothetical protein